MSNYILGPNGDFVSADELYHYGIKGMKWGIRRYQNKDGSLTPAGKKRIQEGTVMFPYARQKKHPSLTQRNRTVGRIETYRGEELDEFDRKIGDTYEGFIKRNPNYKQIFNKHLKENFPNSKYGVGEPYEYWRAHFYGTAPGAEGRTAIYKKWADRFVNEYASATLDDLNLRSTPETRAYTEEWIRKQWSRSGF